MLLENSLRVLSWKKIIEDTPLQNPSSEENDKDLEWHHKLPFDKACVH
jgi:hypothetical protein